MFQEALDYVDHELFKIRFHVSVSILAQASSCSNVRGVFPFTSVSCCVLATCLQASFVVSQLFSCHV